MGRTKTIKVSQRGPMGRWKASRIIRKKLKKGYVLTNQSRGTLGATFLTFTKES